MPYALKMVIDTITAYTGDKAKILNAVAPALWLGGVAWLIFFVVIRVQHFWQGFVIPKFQADIRASVVEYITNHSYRYFLDQFPGSLSNKINDLPQALEKIRMILCWNVVSTSAVVITSFVITLTVSPLAAMLLISWVIIHLAVSIYFAKGIYSISEGNAEDRSMLTGHIVDMISNMTSVRIFARRLYEHTYFDKKQSIEQASNKRLILKVSKMCLFMDMLCYLMFGSLMVVLIRGWQSGYVSVGDIVLVFNIGWAVTFHMWFLSHALMDLFKEVGVVKQALSVIHVPHEIVDKPGATSLRVTKGEIRVDNVSFYYHQNQMLFDNKHVTLAAGGKTGLVGFSGSGKTTFVNLLLRFFDVTKGRILIDGQDIASVTQDSLHEQIAMIPQDTGLFHRSLLENIRYGRLDATEAEILEASKRAHCHEFIELLPQGYNTLVGERGIKLSGGQRQRVAIARAILKNAPILILDEATSALDSVTEKHIQESLHQLMEGRTTIVVAHRLSTLSEMDRILVFDKGQIIEDGTHRQLLKLGGHYAKMWHMQAGGFLPEQEG
jgi:ATP-binding cassette, subfamily B, bacterial